MEHHPGGRDEPYQRDETTAARLDRNWSELVQELRVVSFGVQALFGFLLTLPFQSRFSETRGPGLAIYLVTLLSAALAVALLVAPVALHRLTFREGLKDEVVTATDHLALAGLAALLVALTGSVTVVVEKVAGWPGAAGAAGVTAVLLVGL